MEQSRDGDPRVESSDPYRRSAADRSARDDEVMVEEGSRHLSGEDLSRGPTPATRHPAGHTDGSDFAEADERHGETGGLDDLNDTTQGPTPTIRRTMRATDDDAAAAGQPESDRETRGNVGGNQDTEPARR